MPVSQFSKQIAKGTFWSLSGSIILKLISFLYLIVLARMATQSDVGMVYLAVSVFGILTIFIDFGLRGSLVRYVPFFSSRGENEKILMLLKMTYAVTVVFSILAATAVFFGSDFIADYFDKPGFDKSAFSQLLRLFSPYIILNIFFSLNTSFIHAFKNIRAHSTLLVFQNAAKLLLSLVLFFLIGASLFSITIGILASVFVALLFSLLYIKKPISEMIARAEKPEIGYAALVHEIIPFGIMISIISSFWLIIDYTDRIMIGYFGSQEQVAIYTFATSLAMLIIIFPAAIGTIFFPLISELFGKGKKDEMLAVGNTSLRWMLFIIMPLALVILAFPDSLLKMFYGSAYAVGGLALAIFALGLLIRSLTFIQAFILAGMRLVRIELKIAGASALANIVLNFILIPQFGIEGAAIASAAAFTIATILFIYYSRKMMGFIFQPEALRAVFAGLIALGLIFLAKPYLSSIISMLPELGDGDLAGLVSKVMRLAVFGALFLIAGIVYVVALFILRTFTEEDVNILAAALRRARIPEGWVETISKLFLFGVTR